jgi:hypothetical protein
LLYELEAGKILPAYKIATCNDDALKALVNWLEKEKQKKYAQKNPRKHQPTIGLTV